MTGILNKLENITKINIRKTSRQWSWLVFGKFIGAISALLLASAYARYLTQEEYGTYKYILSIFGILAVFTLQGMEDASQRSTARGNDAAFWDTLKVRFKFGTLTALSSIAVGAYYFLQGNNTLGLIFLFSGPFLIALNTVKHYNTLLIGRQLFKQISINNTLIQIAITVTIIVTVVLTQDLFWLVAAFLGSSIAFGLIGFIHTIRHHKMNDVHDPQAMSYGKHMSLLGIVSIATNQATPFLLWHFLGPVQLAVYSFALAASSQFQSLFKLLTTTMAFPKLSKLETKVLKSTLPKKIFIAHFFTIPTAILLALVIPFVYQILFPTYMDSVVYAQAMTLLLAFSPMRMYSTALMTHGSPRAIHSFSVTNSTLFLGSLVFFIPLLGIWGAVIANIVTQFLSNFFVIYLFRKM